MICICKNQSLSLQNKVLHTYIYLDYIKAQYAHEFLQLVFIIFLSNIHILKIKSYIQNFL